MSRNTDCRDCAHCGNDPDGLYCAVAQSLAVSANYGLNLNRARAADGPCGHDATLFQAADDATLKFRGRFPLKVIDDSLKSYTLSVENDQFSNNFVKVTARSPEEAKAIALKAGYRLSGTEPELSKVRA